MKRAKTIKLPLPAGPENSKKTLPFNGSVVSEKGFSFSFSCLDHNHKLFNLGGPAADGTIGGKWFVDLLDCLKSISGMTWTDAQKSLHDMHQINWEKANASKPGGGDPDEEYWQFRINKSKGRVIGIRIDNVFYIVWLDPHHNLTDSDGYGTALYFKPAKSLYEEMEEQLKYQQGIIEKLKDEIKSYEDLFEGYSPEDIE